MTSADTESMNALQELISERQRYEGWLRALDDRKKTTPPHVFQRVHDDYVARLDDVLQRFAAHADHVRSTIATMTAKLNDVRARESDRGDIRSEAELRAAVGEHSEEEWAKIRDEADLEIAIIAEERQELETELASLQRIIDMVETPTTVQADPVVSEAQSAPTATKPERQTPNRPQPAEEPPPATSLEDLVDWPARRSQPSVAQGDGTPRAPEVDDNLQAQTEPLSPVAAAVAARSAPAVEPRRDNEKTLKCPECSTLNYATEWYCERCGGELATF